MFDQEAELTPEGHCSHSFVFSLPLLLQANLRFPDIFVCFIGFIHSTPSEEAKSMQGGLQ